MKSVDLQADDIIIELVERVNELVAAYNRLEERGVFIVPHIPTPKNIEKAVEKDAEKENTDPRIIQEIL